MTLNSQNKEVVATLRSKFDFQLLMPSRPKTMCLIHLKFHPGTHSHILLTYDKIQDLMLRLKLCLTAVKALYRQYFLYFSHILPYN